MKKQRILALALTATMAMSVFGGMSASAVDKDEVDGFQTYTKPVTGAAISGLDLSKVYYGTYEDAMVDGFENGTVYLFDFAVEEQDAVTYDAVVEKIELALAADETTTGSGSKYDDAITALKAYYVDDTTNFTLDKEDSLSGMSADRKAIIELFQEQDAIVSELVEEFYDDSWGYYGVGEMRSAFESAALTDASSYLLHLASEADRIVPELTMTTTYEDEYNELYDYVASLPSTDYTDRNYLTIERILEDAEYLAADGKESDYKAAIAKLNEYKNVQTVTPDWSDLKAAVEGLFKNGKPAEGRYTGDSNCYYSKDDYDTKSYEWIAFAGGVYDKETIKGAYETAYEVYQDCRYSSTRKYVGQSVVDNALAALDEALLNLDPNFSSKNWVIVMLEDALDSANEIVESDYKTTSSYWKKYLAAVENVEKLLDATAVRETVAADAVKALETAIKNLTKCQISIDSDMRADMTAAKKEAKALLKDKSNKTASQIIALQTALDAAEDTTTSATVSVYEAALNDLQTAITGYSQVQGWYQQNGTWYYGVGDTTAKGWLNLNGTWYYLDPTTGAMATGWLQLGSTWYYLKDWGGMATGWQQVNGSWYYFQSWGGMVSNGWYWIGGSCYYFYNWGGMAANTTIDGYTVNASGAWVR